MIKVMSFLGGLYTTIRWDTLCQHSVKLESEQNTFLQENEYKHVFRKMSPFHVGVFSTVCLVGLFSYLGFTLPDIVVWASFK